MRTLVLLLALFSACIADQTFAVTGTSFSAWTFTSPTSGSNVAINANVGETLTFMVTSNSPHIWAFHTGSATAPDTQISSSNRIPGATVLSQVDGTATISITAAMAGTTIWYVCEIHSGMKGTITVASSSSPPPCNLPANCKSGNCPTCTACNDGFFLNAGQCSACTPANNCVDGQTTCTGSGTGTSCGQCSVGFFISTQGACTACGSCPSGQTVTNPCPGTTNTDVHTCSGSGGCQPTPDKCLIADCSGSCTVCFPGYSLASGACSPLLCLLYGCGFSSVSITCTEDTATTYTCTCAGESDVTVNIADTTLFAGCTGPTVPVAIVLAEISNDHLDAFFVNQFPDLISSVDVSSVDGTTITLSIVSSSTLSGHEDDIKNAFVLFLGLPDVTADGVTITLNKKRDTTTTVTFDVTATTTGGNSASNLSAAFGVALGVVFALLQ